MPETLPERADMRQLRLRAKELLTNLRRQQPEAVQLASTFDDRLNPLSAKLADAQRLLARNFGFKSWAKLVAEVETPRLLEGLKSAIEAGNAEQLETLLRTKPKLRAHLNDPLLGFDSPPIVAVSGRPDAAKTIPILVRYGADPNARSTWWAGGFSALDGAKGEVVDLLLQLGAKYDIWSASAHGQIELVRQFLDENPELVNAPGGDGERPLHFASTPEIAELLIECGADLAIKDVDHESTPIQYQVLNPEVVRVLLAHGAEPDIFTAVALRDLDLLRKILADDPNSALAKIGKPPFKTVDSDGGHIYGYRFRGKTPQQIAVLRGYDDVLHELDPFTSVGARAVVAAWKNDEPALMEFLRQEPDLAKAASAEQPGLVAAAAQHGKTETIRLLLKAGFDPLEPGMDSGTALHIASWFGYPEVVKLLTPLVPLDLGDAHHDSPPLGWALHGSQWCRNPEGDYLGVVQELLRAGADPNSRFNSNGGSLLAAAGEREDLREELRKAGAK